MLDMKNVDVIVDGARAQVGMTFRILAPRRHRGCVGSNSLLALTFFS